MKELKLAIQSDFSDCAIEESIERITEEIKRTPFGLELSISVFDAAYAAKMMIDYPNICNVLISKRICCGNYLLTDLVNGVQVIGGIDA